MPIRGKKDRSFQRSLRGGQSDAEAKLWSHLRNRRLLGHRFRRQHEIGPYTVDLLCPDRSLIVELDGGQHSERVAYDEARTRFLESRGFRVLRFWNDEALARTDAVIESIVTALQATHPSTQPSPRSRGERE